MGAFAAYVPTPQAEQAAARTPDTSPEPQGTQVRFEVAPAKGFAVPAGQLSHRQFARQFGALEDAVSHTPNSPAEQGEEHDKPRELAPPTVCAPVARGLVEGPPSTLTPTAVTEPASRFSIEPTASAELPRKRTVSRDTEPPVTANAPPALVALPRKRNKRDRE